MKSALINYIKKGPYDEIYTPEYAITPIIKYLPKNKIYWEPTDFGGSNITKILKENGFNVISTHKKNFNFLYDKPNFDFDIIITNPPFSLKTEFLKKCYEYNKPFGLLLPITSLEGIERNKLYRQYGIQLLVFDRRIDYYSATPHKQNKKKSGAWFNSSWFFWKILPKDLIFEKLEIN